MRKKEIKTENAPLPVGPYSQAIQVGEFIFCSGQIALDPQTGDLIKGDIETETVQVIKNLSAVLEAAGSSLDDIVKTTIFLVDIKDFILVNAVYASFFGETPPSRTTVQVSALPKGARIEIDCIARVYNVPMQ